MRIGKDQLETLIALGSPTCLLLTTSGRGTAGLVKKGLLREREPGRACCITPAGLRVLADEMEAGRVEDALERIKKEVAARKAKMAEREKQWKAQRR